MGIQGEASENLRFSGGYRHARSGPRGNSPQARGLHAFILSRVYLQLRILSATRRDYALDWAYLPREEHNAQHGYPWISHTASTTANVCGVLGNDARDPYPANHGQRFRDIRAYA